MTDLHMENQETSTSFQEHLVETGAQMKQRAGDALRASTDVAREKFKEAADAAKGVAAETAERVQEEAREKQYAGADFIERFAGQIREASRAFEAESPLAARGIHSAADYVEDVAERLRNDSFHDLVDNATDFAKRQPVAFLGLSVLAGFAAVRFLKASSEAISSSRSEESQ